ncbi:MAG: hypothetical protein ABFR95_08600 [Actinomycetota bacterium]
MSTERRTRGASKVTGLPETEPFVEVTTVVADPSDSSDDHDDYDEDDD